MDGQPVVGLVGLGNIGHGMGVNLLEAGFPLVAYDLRSDAVDSLVARGAHRAASLPELARSASIVIVVVLNYQQVHDVVLGAGGLTSALQPGGTIIVSSTIAPAQARDLAAEVHARGHAFVDAPVTGGRAGAEAGTLSVLVGAASTVFAACRPVLDAVAGHVYYCGPPGAGQTAKMCNQLMAGAGLVATAECLTLAAASGMDRRLLFEIITHGAGDCWMFRDRGSRMLDGAADVSSRLDIWMKDLGIVLDAAEELRVPLLLTQAARQWAALNVAAGHGAEDDTAIVKLMSSLAGVNVRAETDGARYP